MPMPLSRDADDDVVAELLGGQRDLSPFIGVFRGVVQEVREHLGEPGRIDFDENGLGREA